MNEMTALEAAVDELHEADRLLDLYVMRLHQEDAPAELIELAQRLQLAHRKWQDQ